MRCPTCKAMGYNVQAYRYDHGNYFCRFGHRSRPSKTYRRLIMAPSGVRQVRQILACGRRTTHKRKIRLDLTRARRKDREISDRGEKELSDNELEPEEFPRWLEDAADAYGD